MTSGGHNAGIVSEPNHEGRFYFIHERKKDMPYFGPKKLAENSKKRDGSWWLAWHDWLVNNSSHRLVPPPAIDPSLPSAPGKFVLQK